MKLNISPELSAEMSSEMINCDDICRLIEYCTSTHNYVRDAQSGRCTGHLREGYATLWAEFAVQSDGSCSVYKIYTHRMEIKDDGQSAE